jgi:formate/nitrite transporter FocA (FNT family)
VLEYCKSEQQQKKGEFMMTQYAKTFINAILSGLFIGIGGTIYLACPSSIVGAFLFTIGLMMIVCYGFSLYTGAIGYLVNHGKDFFEYLGKLFFIWTGNFIGCFAVGTAIRGTRTFLKIEEKIAVVCADKLNDSWCSLLVLSIFCGLLMYMAVETYRREELPPIFRFGGLFLCISVFIMSGFEHCIADMYYFSLGNVWSWNTLLVTLLLTLGNSLGGWLIPLADKIRK